MNDSATALPAGWAGRWQESLAAIAGVGGIPTVLVCRQAGAGIQVIVIHGGEHLALHRDDLLPRDVARLIEPVFTCADNRQVTDTSGSALPATGAPASIIGFPLRHPDGSVFGALCALGTGPDAFSDNARALMARVRRAMETEQAALEENRRLQREVAAHEATARALRASEALHEKAQRIAKLGHWHHDLVSNKLTWSDELFRIYEIDKTRFPASYAAFLDIVHPEDRQALDETFTRSVRDRCEFAFDYRLLMKDGRIKWMTAHAVTTYDGNGIPRSSAGTTQDISERKAIESALRESEALHRKAQALAKMGHWRLDLATQGLTWSDELFRIFEIDPERFGASYDAFLQLVHPDDREALNLAYSRAVEERTEYRFEHRLQMPDGRIKWISEHGGTTYAADGTPLFSIGTTQDITAGKEASRKRDMLARIVTELRELVFIADLSGNVIYVNESCRRRIAPDGLELPVHALDIVIPEQKMLFIDEILPRLLAGGTWQGEHTYRVFNRDERVEASVQAFGIRDAISGELTHIVNVSLDITEKKAADRQREALERQLLHVQKLESLGVMAGGIAHDFNNILQAIIGNLEIIDPAHPDGPASREALARARQGAIRAADITRQLLTFAGRDIQPRQHLDLGQIVEESANLVRSVIDKRIALRVVQPPGPLPVDAVAGQVQQVLINLVTNAADAIGDGKGTIVVACGRGPAGKAWLEVQDSGRGMDEETQARLFDPFFTSKAHGRGLGMASVLGIVRAHDATIDVTSAPGRGTTVRIVLPLGDRAAGPIVPARATSQPASPTEGTLLLVDDDESIRVVGHALLRRRGFNVTCAAGGAEAIAMLGDDTRRFACVILDLTMPDIDGADVFHALRERHPDLPVLLSSGYDHAEALRRIRPSAHTAFIRKPWRGEELVSALGALLQRQA